MAGERKHDGDDEAAPRRWTVARVIEAVRELDRRGISISKRGLIEAGERRLAQIVNYFGGFRRTRRAAGLPPPARRSPGGVDADADDADVLQQLRMLAREQPRLTRTDFGKHPLAVAVRRRFGSLELAAVRAGVPDWPPRRRPAARRRPR